MGICWVGFRLEESVAERLLANEQELESLLESDDTEKSLDLDKAWHGVHWLLSGSADPTSGVASEAICGGTPIGEDLGYGPPRLLGAGRVPAVAEFLASLDIASLRARFDPTTMMTAEIYPAIWAEADIFDSYLAPSFEAVQSFYATATEAGEGVIQILC